MKVQVVFCSMYDHVHAMAEAAAAGARQVGGAEVTVFQVGELVPDAALERAGAKTARQAFADVPVAQPQQLAAAIIVGTPTRSGNMAAPMRTFLDQSGGLWAKGCQSVRSAACSSRPARSTAGRRQPLPASTHRCSTWEW